ncbi:MAG: C1 family peptidase [Candidatus Euphemobacter frigidus]|nr:C1 family peptidase [Candidatus Euphemobacter frigidus]MDP8276516.1 C1 family peptidase [Candidatus Euphemobacter frigidus]
MLIIKFDSKKIAVSITLSILFSFFVFPDGKAAENDILPFEPGDTLEEIRYKIDHNGYSFTVDHNWVFDMSPEEKARFFSRRFPLHPAEGVRAVGMGPLARQLGRTLPASFDWQSYNGHAYIGAVRDQGLCGSCYAFAACAAAEGTYNYAMGFYDGNCIDFSESYIAWCLGRYGPYGPDPTTGHFGGCDGADYDYMELEALTVEGICDEADFPYQENDPGFCTHWDDQTYVFQSWHRIPCNAIEAIKTAIWTYGVVDAAVYAGSAFSSYSEGIYEDTNITCYSFPCYYTPTNHAISLVGWDDSPPEGGGGVWILRNSWGDTWGESGYMRIRYTSARVACEACYLVYQPPTSPTPSPVTTPTPTPEICTRVDEGFDGFDLGTRPEGWTFTDCNADSDTYTAVGDYGHLSPSIKLDATDNSIETEEFANGDWVQFWVKGMGTDATSSLLVEEYYGGSWSEVTDICSLPEAGTTIGNLAMLSTATRLKFTYTKVTGDLAFDDVLVKCLITPTPTPSPVTTSTPTPSPVTTPTPTPSPVTTSTPTPSPVTTPTPSPTPTPSGRCSWIHDYNGDGTSDIGIFRPATRLWAIRGLTRAYFGGFGDDPVPGDYNGDGTTGIGIFRESCGLWALRSVTRVYFGGSSDLPLPGDYNGDGTWDIGIFRASSGLWAIRGLTRAYFGGYGDEPVPGYYNGNGRQDIGIFRPGSGLWAIRAATRVYFGGTSDETAPGDYSGSGSWMPGIFRPSSGLWAIRGITRMYYGCCLDWPVPAGYAGVGKDSIGIFRENSGLWAVRGVTRAYFGGSSDIPVTR